MLRDLGLLATRVTTGGLLAGHGAQKLFGAFGGYGIEGTGGFMESLGMRPGKRMAMLAGASEFGGGLLTALGLLSPLGPLASIAAMAVATGTAHRGKPIWATAGGAELPVTNIGVNVALALGGPGRLSLDSLLGIRMPRGLTLLAALGTAGGTAYVLRLASPAAAPSEQPAPPVSAPEADTIAARAGADGAVAVAP